VVCFGTRGVVLGMSRDVERVHDGAGVTGGVGRR